ncbi:MAG TPA: cobyrinate a,c-diamide synthase [Longimicrobiales bacterium]|nr:cobyrinate a,c-diamide synthase [Longimicrobiales bacterium]
MRIPRVLVAGLSGGGGKTLVTVGLQAAWRRRGLRVAPFKKGPDYIDAAWSSSAADRPCRNLDLFLLPPHVLVRSFAAGSADADVAVIEGNRGLFDGADARGSCSTAELAKLLAVPVVLVVDCTKVTRTVAASVLGCQCLDPDVPLFGVVLNRAAGARHEAVVREAIRDATGLPVLGVLPRLRHEILPERHLGLVPPAEHGGRADAVREAGVVAERYLDMDGLLDLARQASALDVPAEPDRNALPGSGTRATEAGPAASSGGRRMEAPGRAEPPRVGVFRDAAFQFYYPENLEALARAGARLVEISPLRDPELPDVDALYIGGGFPETLAAGLADNQAFRASLRRAAEAGLPVYAECGGAVYLGQTLAFRGRTYPMAGVLPVRFGFRDRPQGHGYAVVETVVPNPFFPVGVELRGHEFHYTYMETDPSQPDLTFAFRVRRGHGFDGERDGLCHRNVLAAYTHIHALAAEGWAPALVEAAAAFRMSGRAGAAV